MDLSQGWVDCEVKKGLFDSELAVVIQDSDGHELSLFVDKALVDSDATPKRLKVYFQHSDPPRVLLPSESFETGSRWVDVKRIPQLA